MVGKLWLLVNYGQLWTFLDICYLVIWTCKPVYDKYARIVNVGHIYTIWACLYVTCIPTLKETRLKPTELVRYVLTVRHVPTSVNGPSRPDTHFCHPETSHMSPKRCKYVTLSVVNMVSNKVPNRSVCPRNAPQTSYDWKNHTLPSRLPKGVQSVVQGSTVSGTDLYIIVNNRCLHLFRKLA